MDGVQIANFTYGVPGGLDDPVDHVDDAVGGEVVGGDEPGAVGHDRLLGVGVVHGDPQLGVTALRHRRDHVLVVHLRGVQGSLHNVALQDLGQVWGAIQ